MNDAGKGGDQQEQQEDNSPNTLEENKGKASLKKDNVPIEEVVNIIDEHRAHNSTEDKDDNVNKAAQSTKVSENPDRWKALDVEKWLDIYAKSKDLYQDSEAFLKHQFPQYVFWSEESVNYVTVTFQKRLAIILNKVQETLDKKSNDLKEFDTNNKKYESRLKRDDKTKNAHVITESDRILKSIKRPTIN